MPLPARLTVTHPRTSATIGLSLVASVLLYAAAALWPTGDTQHNETLPLSGQDGVVGADVSPVEIGVQAGHTRARQPAPAPTSQAPTISLLPLSVDELIADVLIEREMAVCEAKLEQGATRCEFLVTDCDVPIGWGEQIWWTVRLGPCDTLDASVPTTASSRYSGFAHILE